MDGEEGVQMGSASVIARVGKDGTLVLPKELQEELALREGEEVELVVRRPSASPPADDPLLLVVGIGEGREDGSVNHDAYLYRQAQ